MISSFNLVSISVTASDIQQLLYCYENGSYSRVFLTGSNKLGLGYSGWQVAFPYCLVLSEVRLLFSSI
jgi:hypothetical protein